MPSDRNEVSKVSPANLKLLKAIENKILWLSSWTIHEANHIRPMRDGLKVEGNAKRGRDIHGVNPKNEKKFYKDISDHLGKNIDKYAKIPIEISVG